MNSIHSSGMPSVLKTAMTVALFISGGAQVAVAGNLNFNYHNVSMSALKFAVKNNIMSLKSLPKKTLMAYFMPNLYQNEHGNEFAILAATGKAIKKAEMAVKSWPASGPYVIRTQISFGKYNFTHHDFPLNAWGATSYYSVNNVQGFNTNPWPSFSYAVFLDNPHIAMTLPMPENRASVFIQNRTSYGNVNRSVFAVLTIKLKGFRKNSAGQIKTIHGFGNVEITAHIEKVKIYESQDEKHLLYTYK